MFGLTIIRTKELERLKDVDTFFDKRITEMTKANSQLKEQTKSLSEKLAKFDRERVNGKFVKTTS